MKGKIERARRKKGGEEEKAMAALLVFIYVDFFGDSFWKKKTVWGESAILAVMLFKNPALIYILLTLAANRNLIKKGYILKPND